MSYKYILHFKPLKQFMLSLFFYAAKDRDKKKKQDSAVIDFIINELEIKFILIPIKQRHFVHYNYMCIL